MTDRGCELARQSLAEVALGTLTGEELRRVDAHVRRCERCRHELTTMAPVAAQLLELIPGTEPPLGFDRRVLSVVEPTASAPRRFARRRVAIVAVAAAAAVVFGIPAWLIGGSPPGPHHAPQAVSADFVENGRTVGRIAARGTPLWLTVTVRGTGISGPVTCEVVHLDGSVENMGSFDLVGGSGTWSTPDPSGMADVARAQLVDPDGAVIAVARFS